MFKCVQCPSVFSAKRNLVTHQKKHDGVRFPCTVCASTFTFKTGLNKHLKNTHSIIPDLRQPYAQLDQPAAPIDAQPTRQSVIQFTSRVSPQEYIQIAPQIFVQDISAGGSNEVSEDDLCMIAMDEYDKQNAITG